MSAARSVGMLGTSQGSETTGPELEGLLRSATADTLLTTFKVLTHRVHEYDTGLARDTTRAGLYRAQRDEVQAELLRRLGGAQATG